MSDPKLLHVLQPGQQLSLRYREAEGQILSNLRTMRLTAEHGNPDPLIHVTFTDTTGISLYVARGYLHGGDMEAFLPKDLVMWQSYFSPLNAFNESYVRSKHYTRRFPLDFT